MGQQEDKKPSVTTLGTRVVDALQALRFEAGGPSYAEIAMRISRLRADRTDGGPTASVARSTVYDMFRPDRKRLDGDLVADIVRALGGTEEDAALWRRRCADENAANRVASARSRAMPPQDATATQKPEPTPKPEPRPAPAARPRRGIVLQRPVMLVLALLALSALNVVGGQLVLWFDLPMFLDMIGTAVAAIVLGPWYGVAVAILTQLMGAAAHSNTIGLPFTAVGVAGALRWGYGVRSWGLGRTTMRFFALCVLVAVTSTLMAAPITVLVYGGFSEHIAADTLTARLLAVGDSLGAAVFSANLVSSLLDKLISGFIALTISSAIVRRLSGGPSALGHVRLLTDDGRGTPMWAPRRLPALLRG